MILTIALGIVLGVIGLVLLMLLIQWLFTLLAYILTP